MAEITVQKPVVGDKPAGNHEPKKAVKAVQKDTNEKKKEPKKKIMRKINRAIGYFWNGQMIDF